MRATRFPARANPAERVSGFIAHLRLNGFGVGPAETTAALQALGAVEATDPQEVRLALRVLLSGDSEGWQRFDALFDAYWYNAGRPRDEVKPKAQSRTRTRPALWQPAGQDGADSQDTAQKEPDPGASETASQGEGRLLATRSESRHRRDLRQCLDPESLRAAETAAERIARAIRDRRSRRRRIARKGHSPNLRATIRKSLASGGDPLEIVLERRPERPMRLVVLCDVSGSMEVYARVFLAFVRGLVSRDTKAEAFLFHTRLIRITAGLAERDPLRLATRLSLLAEGFGGGTDIAGCLDSFAKAHGARLLDRRTLVLILSDGYCTASPEGIGAALTRIKRRAGRIVWLNPLKGWAGYAPVAAGIQAALPHLDAHLAANTLEALAALEPEFAKL
ncbi:MAG: VWA domain-containing protein [Pseudomonadota bacterium]